MQTENSLIPIEAINNQLMKRMESFELYSPNSEILHRSIKENQSSKALCRKKNIHTNARYQLYIRPWNDIYN